VKLAHLSDTHLGYEAYRSVSASGENQRGVDIARAFVRCVDDIIEWDPPLVIHSGDLAEKPQVSIRLMLLARNMLTKLASIRPDGTRRQVVIIAGNHDLSSNRKEACFLELYRGIPGVHVVCDDYKVVKFDNIENCPEELLSTHAHCLPHDTLKDMAIESRFGEVVPTPGFTNILVAHGVAGGSGLYKRVLGREYPIPTDVVMRDWEYGALGHWHKQGPISGGGGARCYYAGSSENMGFGDLRDNGEERGYLRVEVKRGNAPVVTPRNLPIRTMFRLPAIDASDKTPEEITTALVSNLDAARAEKKLAGSIVGQNIVGCQREKWALVTTHTVRQSALESAMHYEITVVPVPRVAEDGVTAAPRVQTDVMTLLRERAGAVLQKQEREGSLAVCETLVTKHMRTVAPEPEEEAAEKVAPDAAVTEAEKASA
jgi:DNA repair exonuclease SbcCD nuclease subunit